MLLIFDNLKKMRYSRGSQRGLFKYWPTPESIYQVYDLPKDAVTLCDSDCNQRYCLSNICIQRYFAYSHFPTMRPIRYSTTPTDFQPSADLG